MTADLQVIEPTNLPASNMTLIARTPAELANEQQRLIGWCQLKLNELAKEASELQDMIASHRSHKWSVRPLQNVARRVAQRQLFYAKVREALAAGFYVVPNFPCDIFAIRTTRDAGGYANSTYGRRDAIDKLPDQISEVLPIGSGIYVSPTPIGKIIEVTTQKKPYPPGTTETEDCHHAEAVDYAAMEFPFAFAKPEALTATQQAMALKIFDELGVLPGRNKKVDPMIVGRIVRPWERTRWNSEANLKRHLSFLVVWWLDTATI